MSNKELAEKIADALTDEGIAQHAFSKGAEDTIRGILDKHIQPEMTETGGFWWCPECKREVDPIGVTFEENHEVCGYPVAWKKSISCIELDETRAREILGKYKYLGCDDGTIKNWCGGTIWSPKWKQINLEFINDECESDLLLAIAFLMTHMGAHNKP